METKLGTPATGTPALHAPSRPDRGGGQKAPPRSSPLAALLLCLFILCPLYAGASWLMACWGSTDTGKVLGDFTLNYYSISADGATITSLATTGITAAEAGNGCYVFSGIGDSTLLNYLIRITLTATGETRVFTRPYGGASQNVAWTQFSEMIPTSYVYSKHDRRPSIQLLVKRLSAVPTGTLVFSMTPTGGSTPKVNRQAASFCGTGAGCAYVANSDGTYNAYLVYAFAADDLNMSDCGTATYCTYQYEFEWTLTGTKQTFRGTTPIKVQTDLDGS